ncbi:MAG: hypothetical protein K6G56_01395 [Clostridiales bacterium]|nr:hypothetical protein [Clostridiales bacterium]
MKKTISLLLLVLLAVSLFAGCKKDPYVPEGPTIVDYGEVEYVPYSDETALSFSYLDCFARATEDGPFVANTPDKKGVLTYDFYDSFKEYEGTQQYYQIPSRTFAEIAAFSDSEAYEYLEAALGMVEAMNADYHVDDFIFEKDDKLITLGMEVTATYRTTGEIQKMFIRKFIVENERVYTVQYVVPASCIEKYGPCVKGMILDLANALEGSAD